MEKRKEDEQTLGRRRGRARRQQCCIVALSMKKEKDTGKTANAKMCYQDIREVKPPKPFFLVEAK